MKTYETNPALSIEEFIGIDRNDKSYHVPVSYDFTRDLMQAFERDLYTFHPRNLVEYAQYSCFFGSRFLFECGRIYGIRQERARRRGDHGRQPPT